MKNKLILLAILLLIVAGAVAAAVIPIPPRTKAPWGMAVR